MRLRTALTLAALLALACPAARAQEGQKKDEQVIEDFVGTRGGSVEEPGKKPKRQSAPAASSRRRNPAAGRGSASGKTPPGKGGAQRPLALGYTLMLKEDDGGLVVADPSRQFKTGERFAVALETNADGFLYMFSAEGGRDPQLLFPDARIDGGGNAVAAHARATFPTGPAAEEEHFIEFTAPAATEHLFIIFSRRPLADVPAGEALVKFCGENVEECAWRPAAAQWAGIIRGAEGRRVTEAKSARLPQAAPPPATPGALRRGLKVGRGDPKPAVVRRNDAPDADVLVTEIILTHK